MPRGASRSSRKLRSSSASVRRSSSARAGASRARAPQVIDAAATRARAKRRTGSQHDIARPELFSYMMALSLERRRAFAARVPINLVYLDQLAHGYGGRKPTVEMAVRIERASYGRVRCENLVPEFDWAYFASRTQPDKPGPRPPEHSRIGPLDHAPAIV